MKKIIIILFVFGISVNQSQSQKNEKAPKSKIYYQQKSKKQKTSGTFLLLGGSILTVIGISQVSQQDNVFEEMLSPIVGGAEIVVGAGLAVAGVFDLISSGKNARRAAKLSFNNQRFIIPVGNLVAVRMQPTVTIKISLGNK